jgi:hypothetical protein
VYTKFKADWSIFIFNLAEGLFYTHILSLPPFLFLYKDLGRQIALYHSSAPYIFHSAFLDKVQIPELWVFLFFNVLTQCI